jgi:hypothetical protein
VAEIIRALLICSQALTAYNAVIMNSYYSIA